MLGGFISGPVLMVLLALTRILLDGFTAMAVAGSFIGVKLAAIVPERGLRIGFGWFVLAMGTFVFAQELPTVITEIQPQIAAGAS